MFSADNKASTLYSVTHTTQNNLEKERKAVQGKQETLDKLQETHNTILTETGGLKSQLETLQYNATLTRQGIMVEGSHQTTDKGKTAII